MYNSSLKIELVVLLTQVGPFHFWKPYIALTRLTTRFAKNGHLTDCRLQEAYLGWTIRTVMVGGGGMSFWQWIPPRFLLSDKHPFVRHSQGVIKFKITAL